MKIIKTSGILISPSLSLLVIEDKNDFIELTKGDYNIPQNYYQVKTKKLTNIYCFIEDKVFVFQGEL